MGEAVRKRGPYNWNPDNMPGRKPAPFEDLYIPEPNTGCWLWLGPMSPAGYGNWKHKGRKMAAHRWSLEMATGVKLTRTQFVCHRCDTPGCINPDHLFVGSAQDNSLDMARKRRHWMNRRSHCANGHEFTPENTRPRPDGGRYCITCVNAKLDALRKRTYLTRPPRPFCRHGHAMEGENVILRGVFRYCRTCSNNRPSRRKRAASRRRVHGDSE